MAFPSPRSIFILSTFLPILFMINITPSISSRPVDKAPSSSTDNVTIICNDKPNVQLCQHIFETIPGAKHSKDLETLAKRTIVYAIKEGKSTKTYTDILVKRTTDEKLKEAYSSCSGYYGDFVDSLNEAKKAVQNGGKKAAQNGSYVLVNVSTHKGWFQVLLCADDLIPLKDPSELSLRNEKVDMISRIIIDISDRVQGLKN